MKHEQPLVFIPEELAFRVVAPTGAKTYAIVVRHRCMIGTKEKIGVSVWTDEIPEVSAGQILTRPLSKMKRTGSPIVSGDFAIFFIAGNSCCIDEIRGDFHLTEEMVQRLTEIQPTSPTLTTITQPPEMKNPVEAKPQQQPLPPVAAPTESKPAEATQPKPLTAQPAPEAKKEEGPMSTKLNLGLIINKTSKGIIVTGDLQQVPQAKSIAIDIHEAGNDGAPLDKKANWGDIFEDIPESRIFDKNITELALAGKYVIKPGRYVLVVNAMSDDLSILGCDIAAFEVAPEDSVPVAAEPTPAPAPAVAKEGSLVDKTAAAVATPTAAEEVIAGKSETPSATEPANITPPPATSVMVIPPAAAPEEKPETEASPVRVPFKATPDDTKVVELEFYLPDGTMKYSIGIVHQDGAIVWPWTKNARLQAPQMMPAQLGLKHLNRDPETKVVAGDYLVTITPIHPVSEAVIGTFTLTAEQAEKLSPKPMVKDDGAAAKSDDRELKQGLVAALPPEVSNLAVPVPTIRIRRGGMIEIITDPKFVKELKITGFVLDKNDKEVLVIDKKIPAEYDITSGTLDELLLTETLDQINPQGQGLRLVVVAIGSTDANKTSEAAVFDIHPPTVRRALRDLGIERIETASTSTGPNAAPSTPPKASPAPKGPDWDAMIAQLQAITESNSARTKAEEATAQELAGFRKTFEVFKVRLTTLIGKLESGELGPKASSTQVPALDPKLGETIQGQIQSMAAMTGRLDGLINKIGATHSEIVAAKDEIVKATASLAGLEERIARIVAEAAHQAVTQAMAPVPKLVREAAQNGAAAGVAPHTARIEAAAAAIEEAARLAASRKPAAAPAPASSASSEVPPPEDKKQRIVVKVKDHGKRDQWPVVAIVGIVFAVVAMVSGVCYLGFLASHQPYPNPNVPVIVQQSGQDQAK